MEIFRLKILTIIKLLYFLRGLIILVILGIFCTLFYVVKFNDSSDLLFWILGVVAVLFGRNFFNYLKRVIISKAKHPLPLNLLYNILELGKPYYFGKDQFDPDEIIDDNQLPLTFYYINNHQHPILQFNKDKVLFHHQEYYWKNLNWKYFFYSENPYSSRPRGKYLIEFSATNQNNIRIKNKIEFEKMKAKENEVILLFIIHDLLFGTKASYYY
ncbi:hypothetical protein ACM46_01875 [Chryseobacterium angstadtii]|uniref:Uncharacterized protein n=1 Tax=Chryseobacterium angstadtii TaxID=558151 RepID=A0A0J7IIW8_9FLAO|nr:hypothetical protein [Chryseobacterium angstadtii]KMQ66318.1 hypothetical protein ACM46_01875 [Chryseobacterium angstadtii]